MPFDRTYAEQLRAETEMMLRRRQPFGEADPSASVELFTANQRHHLRMRAAGHSMDFGVDDGVYHLEPDGSDAFEHASWLAQLFDEEAEEDHPQPRREVPGNPWKGPDFVARGHRECHDTLGE